MTAGSVVFLFVLVLAAGFFALNVQRLVSYLRVGVAGEPHRPSAHADPERAAIGIAQKKIFRDPVAGPMHALIFWGFMVLTAGTVEILIQGVFPSFSYRLLLPDAAVPRLLAARRTCSRCSCSSRWGSRSIAAWCCTRSGSRATTSSTPTR